MDYLTRIVYSINKTAIMFKFILFTKILPGVVTYNLLNVLFRNTKHIYCSKLELILKRSVLVFMRKKYTFEDNKIC